MTATPEGQRSRHSTRHETRGRRRRHLVTAATGFVVGLALIAGTNASSADPNRVMYDSWQSDAWTLSPQFPPDRPTQARAETALEEDPPRERPATAERDRPGAQGGDDTIVVTGEVPRAVSIPTMGVQAEVIEVGLDEGGGVFVPEDVRTLGWYTASMPVAADSGSSVIVGHRDSAVQGAGAFSGIENLKPGETIEVTTSDGDVEPYVVREVRMVEKTDFASIVNEAFAMDGEHRLTLITCGGAFDSAAGSYLSNVFVMATPGTA